MGVYGLWKLLEPSGKPVPLESLENKVLAIDISIWLHQAIKGFQDSKGAPLPNAHLLGIYHKVCKLLYFRIKPVFVFDGGVPVLKKETIARRNQLKARRLNDANRIQKQLLSTLMKHSAVSKVLSEKAKANIEIPLSIPKTQGEDDLFKLPPQLDPETSDSDSEVYESTTESSPSPSKYNIHDIDEKSDAFKSLPADVRHEILTDLKETRKQSSWGRLHELPTQSDDFAQFQMKRLLKRFSIQESLEEVEKEMGGKCLSLGELESLLNDHGVVTDKLTGNRIASDENTRYIYMKDIKKNLATVEDGLNATLEENERKKEAIEQEEHNDKLGTSSDEDNLELDEKYIEMIQKSSHQEMLKSKSDDNLSEDKEFQDNLQRAIELSLQEGASTSKPYNYKNDSILQSIRDYDLDSSDDDVTFVSQSKKPAFSAAKTYMLEYAGLTPAGIDEIIGDNLPKVSKKVAPAPPEVIKKPNLKTLKVDAINKPNLKTLQVKSTVDKVKTTIAEIHNIKENKTSKQESIVPEDSSLDVSSSNDVDDVEIMSNSESDDEFVDVHDDKNNLEIVINTKSDLEDDIFADVFSEEKLSILATEKQVIKSSSETISENKETEIICNKIDDNLIEINDLIEDKSTSPESGDNAQEIITEMMHKIQKTSDVITNEDLKLMEENLAKESDDLISIKATKERLAGNMSEQIYQETKELLQLFGVPYVQAPMEAEAQCAFLNEINLTDGTITDDSDIWLFGGQIVYKNFFNQNKLVMEYKAENIQHHFNLTRQQLILLALLVGSDYTVGIQGIGPVTALEVLAAFPPKSTTDAVSLSYQQLQSGLIDFRNWYNNGKIAGRGRNSLRTKLKNIAFNDTFPSMSVIRAYLEPSVETSREGFTWSKPDMAGLIWFGKEKFGWKRNKSEEILKPVLKRLYEHRVQTTLKDYFKVKNRTEASVEDKMSKRVKKAVERIGKKQEDTDDLEETQRPSKKPTKRKLKKETHKESRDNVELKPSASKKSVKTEENVDEELQILKETIKVSRQRVKEIEENTKTELELKQRRKLALAKKEVIPQKSMDQSTLLRNKLKAIEIFRKSQKGPGYIKKRAKTIRKPKDDAELSESSSSD